MKAKVVWFKILKDVIWVFDTYKDAEILVEKVYELENKIIKLEEIINWLDFISKNIKKD